MARQRTDLALEAHELWQENTQTTTRLSGVRAEDTQTEGFAVHTVHILDEEGSSALGKPVGRYITLELDGLLRREEDAFPRSVQAISTLLKPLLPPEGEVLIAGLGSRTITPDLVGPLAAEHTLVTRHLVEHLPQQFGHFRSSAAVIPGVLASTGVESGMLVQALSDRLQLACVIVVDALAARSVERLCRTVQISDSGITPGSGVGNHRMTLNAQTLGIPVIAIGVPTVVSGSTLVMDLLGKEDDTGLPGGDLFVTPKEVDSRVADLSRVIGYGISMALNPDLTVEDLDLLLS